MPDRRSFLATTAGLVLLPIRGFGAAAAYKPVLLKGDYTRDSNHERQARAKEEGCLGVVDFHFNSTGDSKVRGGEIYYQEGVTASRHFAEVMWRRFEGIGLPTHGNQPLRSTATNPRTVFLDHYAMPAILLESLFLSNPDQAAWLHGAGHMESLADAIVAGIRDQFPEGGTIGLSPGHAYKSSAPADRGAKCREGDSEADHTVALAALVERRMR
jgi:N-acetylmuramoyl-L-alanine amidase